MKELHRGSARYFLPDLDRLVEAFRQPVTSEPLTAEGLLQLISEQDRDLATKVRKICSEFEPRRICNMGARPRRIY